MANPSELGQSGSRIVASEASPRKSSPRVTLKIVFLPQSDERLTSISRAAQFDKLRRRGNALDTFWIARDRVYSIPDTRGAVTQQIFRAGRSQIIIDATLGKLIGEAGSVQGGAPRMGRRRRKTVVNSQAVENKHGVVSPSREFVVDRIGRGQEASVTFPKAANYCHLLQF